MIFTKNKLIKSFTGVLLLASLTLIVCCKKKDSKKEETPADETFDKQALLTNLADNLILPAYNEFKTALDSVTQTFETFKVSGSKSDFLSVRQKFAIAYLKYQRISIFGFGPGEDAGVRTNFNIFPCDTTKIKANISSGTYNLSSATNFACKGLPALDYLFYDLNRSDDVIVQSFTDAKRKAYVSDVIGEMSAKLATVITTWNSTYRTTFVNSLSTDVGSSLGYVINQINYELDYLKNSKIATPLGLRSAGTPLPANSEAYYGQQSMQYALETLNMMENVYLGRSLKNADGLGFDDYLDHLGVMHVDVSLNTAIKSQFGVARAKFTAVGNPLSEKVLTTPTVVNEAYTELVKLLVLLKTDMPSSLGVVITYQDGDGD
ncbi:hypothetical protein CNR22_20285 [Sphingobacteriaceae bacterium]|nr:hypothetical protein CNR22_20285 [Sphingobacteriaceae bacterium]